MSAFLLECSTNQFLSVIHEHCVGDAFYLEGEVKTHVCVPFLCEEK
jgi:hypothetical protein